MVRGLNKVKMYFSEYADNYVIIGGTACDIIIEDTGLTARATKDIDVILITEALMCLKAKAYLEIEQRIADGGKEEKKHLRKHKGDVFRLAALMSSEENFELPENIKANFQSFMEKATDDLPDKAIFKEMGLSGISVEKLYDQIMKAFNLISLKKRT